MKAIIFFIFFTVLAAPTVYGQIKIGDNPQNIDASSVLELESTSKVLVITRVTTLEMEAITPQRGGMVYNTDTECINYYDGTQWINLCDAANLSITNDPIVNGRSTIEITEAAGSVNLEVAKNSILGDNIIDGGIGPDDIQDNSITQEKLAAESVGSSELRQNAVGTEEIRDGSIAPSDLANTIPDQLLTTDENGIVQWEDANDFYDLTFNETDNTLTIAKSTTAGVSTISLDALVGSDNQQLDLTNNILSIENNPNTVDLSNYLQELSINPAGTEISLTNGGTISLPPGTVNTDEQQLSISGSRISLTDGGFVDLPANTVNTDEQQLSISGNRISLTDGGFVDIPEGNLSLDDGFIFVGNATSEPTPVAVGGDLTMNNIGEYTIEDEAVTPLKIEPGLNGQFLSTVDGAVTWAPAPGGTGGGSTEVADQTTISGTGEALDPFTITPGTNGQFLSTNVDGDVIWATPPGATGGTTEFADGVTISGDGTTATPFTIVPGANGQVLSTDVDGNVVWTAASGTTGGTTEVADGVTITGLGTTASPFTIQPASPTITSNQMLITNSTTGAVEWDDIPEGSGGTVITDAITITGNGTTGSELALAENAVTSDKIAADVILAEDINTGAVTTDEILDLTIISEDLADNAVTVNKINGGTDGQILTTTATGVSWEDADNNILIVSEDADNSLTVSATDDGAYYDDSALTTAIAANTAAILLKENAINKSTDGTLTDNSDDDFPTEQAVKTYVDNQIDALSVGDNLSNSNLTQTIGENRTFEIGEDDALIFTGLGRVGIGNGALSPQNKLHVAGTVRSEGFNSSQGSEGFPAYSFSTGDDIDTGMYRPAADEIGFSVGGFEALRIEEDADDTNVIVNQSLQLNNLLLDKDGESGTAGQILSSTGTQTDWINAPTPGTTYTEGNGITISAADAIGITPLGVNTAELATDAVTTDKINNATILNEDIQNSTIEPIKMNASGNNDEVLTISGGNVVWAPVTPTGSGNITSPNSTIAIGGATNALLGNVTIDLNPNSIGPGEIEDDAISSAKLQDNAVTSAKISDGSIVNEDIALGAAIDGSKINPNFTVGIITTGGLSVGGDILMNGNTVVPDYVFQKYFLGNSILNPNYEFNDLAIIEAFVKENNHLPGIQSAQAVKEQGFWNVSESSRVNLEKIEELFLHTIEQEKKIKELQSVNTNMSTELEALKAQMAEIKIMLLEKQNN
ncbi:hypothetical protein PXC01_18030 [Maribacter sp. M208]|uniref:beta strand repeat-containing protein n=1 Tax=Maribacter huludaoensis TaxID=3030010 RepID=UPI0023EC87CC|nr:hypothetical protein [Maribacter huludaoensis]MDF4223505.1 hypothetical protein [Maribacter huludaoensis]